MRHNSKIELNTFSSFPPSHMGDMDEFQNFVTELRILSPVMTLAKVGTGMLRNALVWSLRRLLKRLTSSGQPSVN